MFPKIQLKQAPPVLLKSGVSGNLAKPLYSLSGTHLYVCQTKNA